jgi:molecular chaperone GrpE
MTANSETTGSEQPNAASGTPPADAATGAQTTTEQTAPTAANAATGEAGDGEAGAGGEGGGTAPPEDPLAALTAERDAARAQAQEYLALAQRSQADFQNFRRRAEQERAESYDRGRGEVVLQILLVLDDFVRAMAALPPERHEEDWVQGLQLIERKLRSTLEALGVERIEAEGQQFDPWEHEAVLHEVRDNVEPGTVAQVARPGYRLGSKVLRPAQVVVAKAP